MMLLLISKSSWIGNQKTGIVYDIDGGCCTGAWYTRERSASLSSVRTVQWFVKSVGFFAGPNSLNWNAELGHWQKMVHHVTAQSKLLLALIVRIFFVSRYCHGIFFIILSWIESDVSRSWKYGIDSSCHNTIRSIKLNRKTLWYWQLEEKKG